MNKVDKKKSSTKKKKNTVQTNKKRKNKKIITNKKSSVTKVSAYNANNKIFPVLEKYTCTEEEKQALKSKIQYNGMSVGRIGTISEFLTTEESYIKCKLIRLTNLPDDFNIVNTIANELNKGVFV